MAELKTKPTRKSVVKFLKAVENQTRREDCMVLLEIMKKVTGEKPVLWGESIIGFGKYHYKQRSGQIGMWPLTGFSPRKHNLTVYIMPGFGNYKTALKKLGKHKHSVSCLYLSKLTNVDIKVLEKMIADSVSIMRARYPEET
ncbi:MAG: DUF1801 domain-containing protein [bacterium]